MPFYPSQRQLQKIQNPVLNHDGELLSKRCPSCLRDLVVGDYYTHKENVGEKVVVTLNGVCKSCFSVRWDPSYQKESAERKDPNFRAKYILKDAVSTDRNMNRKTDLDLAWIQSQISLGCSYCGCKSIKMSLDRIDNSLGHLKTNVVPACMRCNFIRKTMPYDAWLCVVPGIKAAYEQGLFGDWTGFFDRSGRKTPVDKRFRVNFKVEQPE